MATLQPPCQRVHHSINRASYQLTAAVGTAQLYAWSRHLDAAELYQLAVGGNFAYRPGEGLLAVYAAEEFGSRTVRDVILNQDPAELFGGVAWVLDAPPNSNGADPVGWHPVVNINPSPPPIVPAPPPSPGPPPPRPPTPRCACAPPAARERC